MNLQSEATVYERAIKNCGSTSSEGEMDTSDESIEGNEANLFPLAGRHNNSVERASTLPDPMPSTSREYNNRERLVQLSSQDRAEKMVRDAEHAKAQILPPKGNQTTPLIDVGPDSFRFIDQMDEDYLVIDVDDTLAAKIINGMSILVRSY